MNPCPADASERITYIHERGVARHAPSISHCPSINHLARLQLIRDVRLKAIGDECHCASIYDYVSHPCGRGNSTTSDA